MANPAIRTNGLCRRYGRRWALIDVTLEVPAGAGLVVAGRNGSGKSTLLRLIASALRPDRGEVEVDGFDTRRQRDQVRMRTALLGHDSFLYEAMTPLENLRTFAALMGRPADREALMPVLVRTGLGQRANDTVSTFSAGMRKRLSLARVLLQNRAIVLLDEPYGNLDPPGFALVDEVVAELRSRGVTVLMATHQLERAAAMCDRGVMLEEGRVMASDSSAVIAERAAAYFRQSGGAASWS